MHNIEPLEIGVMFWGGRDPVFPPRVMNKFEDRLTRIHARKVFDDASHFLQEDRGQDIGHAILELMTS